MFLWPRPRNWWTKFSRPRHRLRKPRGSWNGKSPRATSPAKGGWPYFFEEKEMSNMSSCPYCGHKITRAEYEKIVTKVEAVVKARVTNELSAARRSLEAEWKKVKALKQSTRQEARDWAESQIDKKTGALRQEVGRLKRLRAAARENGVMVGRREVQ